jgi:CBS domain-containing protein
MKTQGSYKKLYAETLRDIMNDRAVLKFNSIDSVPDIMRRLRARHAKVAGVVGVHGNLVGMLTENGIIRRIFSRFDNPPPDIERLGDHKGVSHMIALDVMIENPDTLHIDDTVEDALDMMTYLSHSYMPVIDDQKKLLGIVDTTELRRSLEKKYGALRSLDDPISLYAMQQKLYDLNLGTSHVY